MCRVRFGHPPAIAHLVNDEGELEWGFFFSPAVKESRRYLKGRRIMKENVLLYVTFVNVVSESVNYQMAIAKKKKKTIEREREAIKWCICCP